MNLRYLLPAFLLISPLAFGETASSGNFDPVAFQKRFEKADINKDGKLTRDEAYAEFPRMPEFFDEIDANADGAITIKEVRAAMDRRVNAAMEGSKAGKRFVIPQQSGSGANVTMTEKRYFPSRQAAQRYYRFEYYESIANHLPVDTLPSTPLEASPAPAQIRRAY